MPSYSPLSLSTDLSVCRAVLVPFQQALGITIPVLPPLSSVSLPTVKLIFMETPILHETLNPLRDVLVMVTLRHREILVAELHFIKVSLRTMPQKHRWLAENASTPPGP